MVHRNTRVLATLGLLSTLVLALHAVDIALSGFQLSLLERRVVQGFVPMVSVANAGNTTISFRCVEPCNLPDGVDVDDSNGEVVGRPLLAGRYENITIAAFDSGSDTLLQHVYTLVVVVGENQECDFEVEETVPLLRLGVPFAFVPTVPDCVFDANFEFDDEYSSSSSTYYSPYGGGGGGGGGGGLRRSLVTSAASAAADLVSSCSGISL